MSGAGPKRLSGKTQRNTPPLRRRIRVGPSAAPTGSLAEPPIALLVKNLARQGLALWFGTFDAHVLLREAVMRVAIPLEDRWVAGTLDNATMLLVVDLPKTHNDEGRKVCHGLSVVS